MALYLVRRDDAPSGPGTAVACRCCPAGVAQHPGAQIPLGHERIADCAVIEPLQPAPGWTLGQGGSPGIDCCCDIVNAIRYLTHDGPVWWALPADLPHWRTVYGYVQDCQASVATRRMHDELASRSACWPAAARPRLPRSSIPSWSRPPTPSARPAADMTPGRRYKGVTFTLAVDVMGLILAIVVTAASVQDRDGARPLLWRLAASFGTVTLIWADGGYAGKLVTWAAGTMHLTWEIVKRPDNLHTFQVLPCCWVIERTFGWIMKHRRCVRDYERLPQHHETYL